MLAGPGGEPVRYSCEEDLRRVHKLRAACDAILVGVGTVLADDPHLAVKEVYARGEHPRRVVLDGQGRTPSDARVLNETAETLVYHAPGVLVDHGKGVPIDPRDLESVLADLWSKGVRTLLVEGGANVLVSFVEAGLWDSFTLYQAPALQGEGTPIWPGGLVALKGKPEPYGRGALWRFSP